VTTTDRDRLGSGALAQMGLMDEAGIEAGVQLLERVRDDGLETVRVLFADPHGVLRGKAVAARALPAVLADGMKAPSTLLLKDTAHRTAFPIWAGQGAPMAGASDILLIPDAPTFRRLPWSPHSGWLLCDFVGTDGAALPMAPRALLRDAMGRLAQRGMEMLVGLEVEFHVFDVVDPRLEHDDTTMPAAPPETRSLAPGYQFLTETVYGQLEPMMDRLRRVSEEMGLPVRTTEVEMGPGQFEFTFDPADPMTQADAMVMFRTLVKEVCAADGKHATFMCRPKVGNAAASGWHVHQSLLEVSSGKNLFMPSDDAPTDTAAGWIAGLLAHARESCLLTTPTVNGYKRYTQHQLAPDRIAWGRDNRGAMLRALMAPGDEASRVENRVADPAANPYLLFASQIVSGLAGLEAGKPPPDAVETPYSADATALPTNLGAAIAAFQDSALYREAWGAEAVDYLATLKGAEWARYLAHVSDWEQAEYFRLF
jgi:glutamine synthetase